jgi:phage replication O-like protein O
MKGKEGYFTQYPNEIQEALHTTNFTALESRILHFIIRRTFGHHKSTFSISQRTIETNTGIDRRTVRKILQRLRKRKILLNKPFVKGGRSASAQLGVNPNVNAWLRVGVIQPPGGEGSGRSEVGDIRPPFNGRHSTAHLKEKRNIKKKENAQDGEFHFSALLGSKSKDSPLTEKQFLANVKIRMKKENRTGVTEAVEEQLNKGTSMERISRSLDNRNVHGADLVQVIRELSAEVKK